MLGLFEPWEAGRPPKAPRPKATSRPAGSQPGRMHPRPQLRATRHSAEASLASNKAGVGMGNQIDRNGKNAIVAGGAQGIGRAIVERFLQSGAAAAIWDRDATLAEKTAAELKGEGRGGGGAVGV